MADSLEEWVFGALEALEAGGDAALERFLAELGPGADAVRARLRQLAGAGLFEPELPTATPRQLSGFTLLAPLGRGGMGVVYRALEAELGREVALKLLHPTHALVPGARLRFRREAEAVARLSHPGIVQVHRVGEDQGVPFLAMELLRGVSLGAVLDRLAGCQPKDLSGLDLAVAVGAESPAPAVFQGSWFQVVSRLVAQVARALEHAHQHGVLHRDIKPSNVFLTRDGRAVLLDFGLAQLEGADRLTRTGAHLGSLPYMAPEQVRGEAVDHRADIYALGLLYYELLTLEQPFLDGTSSERTRARILAASPTPPRRRLAEINRDAEAVCLVAMDPVPARRHQSAGAVALDLENALAGQSVSVRRPGPLRRLGRLAARHRGATLAATLGGILVLGGPWLFAVQEQRRARAVGRVNTQLESALTESDRQRKRAEANLEVAFTAVDRMLARVGNQTLEHVPHAEALREDVLREALFFYDQLRERETIDGEQGERIASTELGLAHVLARLGQHERALEVLAALIGDESAKARRSLSAAQKSRAHHIASGSRRALGDLLGAVREARAAAGLLEADPSDPTATTKDAPESGALGRELALLGRLEFEAGERDQGTATLKRAIELLEAALVGASDSFEAHHALGQAYDFLALCQSVRGDGQGSLASRRAAVLHLEKAVELEPDSPDGRSQLAASLGNLGDTWGELGRPEEGRPSLERALSLASRLAADFPLSPRFRYSLAMVQNQMSLLHISSGDSTGARAALEAARLELEPLCRAHPNQAEYAGALGGVRVNLAILDAQAGHMDAAIAALGVAQGELAGALALAPNSAELLDRHWQSHDVEVGLLLSSGRFEQAGERALGTPRGRHVGQRMRTAERLASAASGLSLEADRRKQLIDAAVERLEALRGEGLSADRLAKEREAFSSLQSDPRFLRLLQPTEAERGTP